MSQLLRNRYLYMVNFSLLVTFQIASAYWQLWNIFKLPGGIDLFLGITLVFAILSTWGLLLIVNHKRQGLYFSLFLAAAGLVTCLSSLYHLFFAQTSFRPFSLIVLAGLILVVSILQGIRAAENLITIYQHHRQHQKETKHTHATT